MLRRAALVTGTVFLLIGISGFLPFLVSDDKLLGLFRVGVVHNAVHLLSGAAFLAASGKTAWARVLFKIMGVLYGLVAVLGFFAGSGRQVLGLFYINTADNLLHLVLALAFLYFGFGVSEAAGRRDTSVTS